MVSDMYIVYLTHVFKSALCHKSVSHHRRFVFLVARLWHEAELGIVHAWYFCFPMSEKKNASPSSSFRNFIARRLSAIPVLNRRTATCTLSLFHILGTRPMPSERT